MRQLTLPIALTLFAAPVFGCSPISGNRGRINVASEKAVIVWDAKTHTEHFVRSAEFDTDQPDFGFLVPTPTQPTLTAVNDGIFDALEEACRPRVIHNHPKRYIPVSILWGLVLMRFLGGTASAPLKHAPSVDVLSEGRVGKYDAAVLRADNTNVLSRWLNAHGYVNRPAVKEWLRTYVRRHWVITAFKVSGTSGTDGMTDLNAVRMSFHADQPFYPYSEPKDMADIALESDAPRLLRLFIISNDRMDGALDGVSVKWPGKPILAGTWNNDASIHEVSQQQLAGGLHLSPLAFSSTEWLTAFEDTSSPRPGVADLIFTDSPSQSPLPIPPRVFTIPNFVLIWLDPLFVGLWILRNHIRKRRFINIKNLPEPNEEIN